MELLERDHVLADLAGLVERARAGDGHVVLLRGEAGIGKTAVARALAGTVSRRAKVLWGSCDDLLAARPLGPVWDMSSADPQLASALRVGDQRLVRQALLDLFTATHRPTVAVVEDVHWADEATLDLVTLLGRRIRQTNTLLLLTFREVPADHPLRIVLGDLPAARVHSHELRPLSDRAVAELAHDPDVAARVVDQTGGNPFLVSAMLSDPGQEVPATVRDLMGSLVARLDPAAEQLVRQVAVVPGRAELALLDDIDPDLLAALDSAEHLGLLQLADDAVAFRHELARTAIEADLDERRRRRLHRRVLAAGERLAFDPARLAHHARLAHDVEAMVRLLPAAARDAAARGSHREALTHLDALEPHLEACPLVEQAELHELWASEAVLVTGEGLRHARLAVDLRRRLGDDRRAGLGMVAAARSAWASGDYRQAASSLHHAVEALGHVGGRALASAHAELARMAVQDDDLDRATHHAERALSLAPEPGEARALALATAGYATNLRAWPDGCSMLEESAAIAESLDLPWMRQRAVGNLIDSALDAKDLDRARRLNDEAMATVDDDIVTTRWHVIMDAAIDTAAGDYAAAAPVLRDLVGRDGPARAMRLFAEVVHAGLLVRRGDPDAAVAVQRLWDGTCAVDDVPGRARVATTMAQYLWVFQRSDAPVTRRNLEIFEESVERAGSWTVGEHALWLWLDGHVGAIPDRAAAPVRWLGDGDWQRAASWFADRGVPFEQAVALGLGDTDARLEGLRISQRIGARALAARLRDDLRADGVTGLPRGPRAATRRDPFGLTPRQGEVLALLVEESSNAEIAERLFLSVRTVENHVSAILARLAVATRDEAAEVAARVAATGPGDPGAGQPP